MQCLEIKLLLIIQVGMDKRIFRNFVLEISYSTETKNLEGLKQQAASF